MRKKSSPKKSSFKLTKGNVITIITALIAGICTIIAAFISLANPVVSKYFEKTPTATSSPPPLPTTNIPTPTIVINPSRLDPIATGLRSCSLGTIYAVPNTSEIPPEVSGSDVWERYSNTQEYLNQQGFLLVAQSVNSHGMDSSDPRTYAQSCDSVRQNILTTMWNDSSARVFIKEVTLIIEAYDYEPSHIPNNYETVVLIPPQLGGGGDGGGDSNNPLPTPIPRQSFDGELKSTSNSFPFMSMIESPPIIVESGLPLQFLIVLDVKNAGTYRMHLTFYIEDSQGKQIKLDSQSFIAKFAFIDNLNLEEVIPIDVK